MDIKDDHLYSIKEGVKLTGILHRTLTRKASKLGAIKIDGRFLLSGHQIKELIKNQANKQAYLEKRDSQPLVKLVNSQQKKTKIIASKDDNEALKLEIKLLKAKLSEFDVKENERLEVFTEMQYSEFEKRLRQYPEQKKIIQEDKKIKRELEFKLEIEDLKLKGAENIIQLHKDGEAFWKAQSEYKDKQNEKFLAMHSILVESVSNFSKKAFIEATVKAKNTDWTKKDKK
jgi:hypothetical protein